MADIQPIQEPVKTRQSAWGELATQQYGSEDIPLATAPSEDIVYDTDQKVGLGSAFLRGTPNVLESAQPEYKPDYQPTVGENVVASLGQFARSGVKVGMELWDKDTIEARKSINELRKVDPEAADELESVTLGKKLSNTQLAVKGGAAVGEAALSFLPFFKVGRAAIVAGEAATLARAGKVGKVIEASATLSKLYSGGLNGALYGGLYGLHSTDADWNEAAKNAAMGGVFGAGLMGAGQGLAFVGKYGANKTMQGFKFVAPAFEAANNKLAEMLPAKWYSAVFSVGSTMKKYYGDVGDSFIKMYKVASKAATMDLGRVQLGLIDQGLMEVPTGMSRGFKGVEFVGDDLERMALYNQVLRGKGAYADPVARAAAIESDARLQFLDGLRKHYGATAQREGVVDSLLDLDTYLPKHTPIVEMGASVRDKVVNATDDAAREAIYAAHDPMVKEMVENAVQYEKTFKTRLEAYQTYYDYADIVGGGSHTPVGDNKMLQRMVNNGEAQTINEARGMIIDDLKFQKKSLTPLAGSLDFKRKVDLPWYDPNPSRVMPQYTFDASMRIEMAKKFGANDEVLHEMIGSIKADLDRGIKADEAAKTFEKFVRAVTGQVERVPGEEKVSAFLRALEVPKLAFAQIVNLGQSLNTLLASDLGSVMHGVTKAFTEQGTRDAIERGVLTNSFIRQIFDYNSGGSKLAENFMKYSGFTYTEMFNRSVGSSAADMWGKKNLEALLKKYGIPLVDDEGKSVVTKMIAEKAMMQEEALQGGIKVQGELFDKFRQMFPDEDFTATAGNLGAAKERLATLNTSIKDKTGKLQKAKALLEKELLSKSEPLTAAQVDDLVGVIDQLRSELKAGEGINIGTQVKEKAPVKQYTPEQQKAALDGATQLRRAKLEEIITRLESRFDEVHAMGDSPRDIVTMHGEAAKTPESLENYVARIHEEIGNIDDAIVGLQNELTDKQSILEAAINSYDIAEKRVAAKNPNGTAYDQHFTSRKTENAAALEKIKTEMPNEYHALTELGIPVDDVIARGFMTKEEQALASQTFVERTQFLGHPVDLPYFASTPVGKVFFQFKTFAYQQARFITSEMKNAAARKDYSRVFRNLFVLSTVFPMTGEVLADIRSLITQEKRPTKALDRYVADIFAAGTYGMFYDYYKSAESGNTAKTLLGAAPGDAITYLEQLAKLPGNVASGKINNSLNAFTKQILRQTGVGRPAVNVIYPTTGAGESSLKSLIDWAADE